MLGSQRSYCETKQIQALLTAARASGGKNEYQVRLTGIEQKCWMDIEIGRLGAYEAQSQLVMDPTKKGGEIGAGYVNPRKNERKVERDEEGSCSNRRN